MSELCPQTTNSQVQSNSLPLAIASSRPCTTVPTNQTKYHRTVQKGNSFLAFQRENRYNRARECPMRKVKRLRGIDATTPACGGRAPSRRMLRLARRARDGCAARAAAAAAPGRVALSSVRGSFGRGGSVALRYVYTRGGIRLQSRDRIAAALYELSANAQITRLIFSVCPVGSA